MTNFILDENYTISEFVKNIVFINHSIIEQAIKNSISIYADLIAKLTFRKTQLKEKN